MAQNGKADPYLAYNFKLDVQNITQAHFTACVGLGAEVQVIKYREAGGQQVIRHIPGQVNYKPVTMYYGLTQSHELFDWMMDIAAGKISRRNVSIMMLDSEGTREVMRWNLFNAWPAVWDGLKLDTLSQEIGIISLTIVYDSLARA